MSANTESGKQQAIGEESLLPQEHRVWDNVSYLFAWIGGCVFIGYFMMGASLVPPVGKLNLFQAIVCISVSALIVSVCFNINGQAGHKYGIPFIVQTRHSFGMKGSWCNQSCPSNLLVWSSIMGGGSGFKRGFRRTFWL